jgi:polar amino acid transport system permease protein
MSPSSSDRPRASVTDAWVPSDRELERARVRRSIHRRGVLVATAVTVLVLGAIVAGVVSSPGWPRFRETFLSWPDARAAFPDIAKGFWINVKMFLVAEPLILVLGGLVAITRGSVSPWLTPARFLAVVYTDLFRGMPTILVVFVFAFGIPALALQGITTSFFWLGTAALVLSYGAYVAEVIRSGIESIHPSQLASAEALGLSRPQTMRFVVLPQALRRVVPPLLNDFVSLQKDTALVGTVGVFEALYVAADYGNYNFNFTPYLVTAAFFVALTVPLARVTDWLGRRAAQRERGSR